MTTTHRKSLDQFSDDSERFERRFEALLGGEDLSARSGLIAEIEPWMREVADQGRYVPAASAERRAYRSMLERWVLRLRDQGHYVERPAPLAEFDPRAGFVLEGPCPYPGLDPYDDRQRASFVGREGIVRNCVEHLEQPGNRILLLVGASGSGKSSVAMAGVLPRLRELHGAPWCFGPRFTPGAHPIRELAAAVAQAAGQPEARGEELRAGLSAAPGDAAALAAGASGGRPLVLFVDQFEELFTLCRDPGEQRAFAEILCALSRPGEPTREFSCRILVTIRSDHVPRIETADSMAELQRRLLGEGNTEYLSTIGFDDIKRAIKGPADGVGLRFVPATLVDELASQTAGLSNGLPLLQFALRRLWDTRPRNEAGERLDLVDRDTVDALPDVEHALGAVAEGIFEVFTPRQQEICERLLLELVVLDDSFEEPLRRRRHEAELAAVLEAQFPGQDDLRRVFDAFVQEGLLRRFGEGDATEIEVAHEALLRRWDHIYALLTGPKVKERLHLVKQIGREGGEWIGHDRAVGYLGLRGERLARAVAYVAEGWLADADAKAYVEACRAREELDRAQERIAQEEKARADHAEKARIAAHRSRDEARIKLLTTRRNVFRGALAVAVAVIAAVAWSLYRTSEESVARKLAMAAANSAGVNSQRALLLAVEAARHGRTTGGALLPEVENALRSAIRGSHVSALLRTYGRASVYAAEFTPDGATLVLGDSTGGVTFWDVATGFLRRARFAHVDGVNALAFSPDGRRIATGSEDGTVVIWDAEQGAPQRVLSGHAGGVNALAFSRPDGAILATASEDASVRLWDAASGSPIGEPLFGHSGPVVAVAFVGAERQLATGSADGRVVVWDVPRQRALYAISVHALFDLDVSHDGSMLAIGTGAEVEIWNTETRSRQWTLAGHTNSVFCLRFGHDDRTLASAAWDRTVIVWSLPVLDAADTLRSTPQQRTRLQVEAETTGEANDFVTAIAFGPHDALLAGVLANGTTLVWTVANMGEVRTLAGSAGAIGSIAFGPDGSIAAAAEGRVLAWERDGGRRALPEPVTRGTVVAFAETGALAVAHRREVLVASRGAREPRRLEHPRPVTDLAFAAKGTRLVAASVDGTAVVWDLASGRTVRVLTRKDGTAGRLRAVATSADGALIAAADEHGTVDVWKDGDEAPERILEGDWEVLDLAITPGATHVVSATKEGLVRIWNVAERRSETLPREHSDTVPTVAVAPGRLATGADDAIRVWDIESLDPIQVFPVKPGEADRLAFSADGRHLAAGGRDGIVRVYALDGSELVDVARRRIRRGWTADECDWYLGRGGCERTPYRVVEEAYERLARFDVVGGERLLREARAGAEPASVAREIDARVGTSLLWGAQAIAANPGAARSELEDPDEVARRALVAAKDRLKDPTFDPAVRLERLRAYLGVTEGRALARAGKVAEAEDAFARAARRGWTVVGEPARAARLLSAAATLERASEMLRDRGRGPIERRRGRLRAVAAELEEALRNVPELSPAHGTAADLYRALDEYPLAEAHLAAQAASRQATAEPLAALASVAYERHGSARSEQDTRDAIAYARRSLERDPDLDLAWFIRGTAEQALARARDDPALHRAAAAAFDRVRESSPLYAAAQNHSGSIHFEDLQDQGAAFPRMARAAQLAPDNEEVLTSFAGFLLASGRDAQAERAAARAAALPNVGPARKAAMAFVRFGAELLSGDRAVAARALDDVEAAASAAAAAEDLARREGKEQAGFAYRGIRRSLERRLLGAPGVDGAATLQVLTFVETNGKRGTLAPMRRWLAGASEAATTLDVPAR